ncbi:hypothetical protein [Aurantiacibacter suaedae]|uniref:hypothetical protein n=1 Tax=Aurantiacibacter suaedae TaxID=2545755 RepID=UPI0010F8DE48|nr:hypothetical protein [Aurantiacibacter suaedae]
MPAKGHAIVVDLLMNAFSVPALDYTSTDTYRFNSGVDGPRVADRLATTFSRERSGINSTVEVIGPEGARRAPATAG